jgi:hypothetical protein
MSNLNFVGVEVKEDICVKSVGHWLQTARVTEWRRAERCGLLSMASLTTALFSGVHTVFTLPPFFFRVEPVTSKFRTQVLMTWADGAERLR